MPRGVMRVLCIEICHIWGFYKLYKDKIFPVINIEPDPYFFRQRRNLSSYLYPSPLPRSPGYQKMPLRWFHNDRERTEGCLSGKEKDCRWWCWRNRNYLLNPSISNICFLRKKKKNIHTHSSLSLKVEPLFIVLGISKSYSVENSMQAQLQLHLHRGHALSGLKRGIRGRGLLYLRPLQS